MSFKFSRRFVLSAIVTIIWMVIIFLFSAQNGDESSETSSRIVLLICSFLNYSPSPNALEILTVCVRKAAHMTEFGILGLLTFNTLYRGFGSFHSIYPLAFAFASLYAATDEIHQLFIGGRSGQFTDWIIDSTGIILWLFILWSAMKIFSSIRGKSKEM